MSDLTTLTGQLAAMKQAMIDRLTAQGVTGYTMSSTMEDIVAAYQTLRGLDYDNTTITENGVYIAPNGKTGYNNFTVNVPTGGPATHRKFQVLDRVYDDVSGDSIGTVVGFHYDANDVEYAVVCLDAVYRKNAVSLQAPAVTVPNLPTYGNAYSAESCRETATFNCDKIMDWVNASPSDRAASGVQHCRSNTFYVGGVLYAGQVPTVMEMYKILEFGPEVNAADPTATSYSSNTIIGTRYYLSSIQGGSSSVWGWTNQGTIINGIKNGTYFVVPVLEIPNVVTPAA